MALATGVIGTLLPKLHELSEEGIGLPKSVRGEIMFLITELESLQGALRRVWSEKPADQIDEQDKLWNEHAAEVSHDIDGLVDKFLANTSGFGQSMPAAVQSNDFIAKINFNCDLTTAKARREFSRGIRNATRLFKEFVERHGRYRISTNLPRRGPSDPCIDESRDGVAVEFPKDDDLRKLRLSSRALADFAFLRTELEVVNVVLRKLAKVPAAALDKETMTWATGLREVSCKLREAVDNFNKATAAKARRRLAINIMETKDSFFIVSEARPRWYDLSEIGLHGRTTNNPLSGTVGRSQDPGSLIAIDGPRKVLVNLLVGEASTSDQALRLVKIVGLAGVGKTALAKEVHRTLAPQFDCTTWVSMPAVPDMKEVLQDLLRQICQWGSQHSAPSLMDGHGQHVVSEMNQRVIINKIRHTLQNKRYFIVVEDIPDSTAWNTMKQVLIESNNGSAVLMTSRKVDIAEDVYHAYRLQPISVTKSSPELVKMGEKSAFDWYTVRDSDDISMALDLSYNNLPHYLKPCMLYLSMFQKGCKISGERVVWGWIAEGFIQGTRGKPLQEVGESYLNELIETKLIEPLEVDACVLDNRKATSLPDKVQRLSIQGNSVPPQVHLSDVRSLVVSGDANLMPSLTYFRELRALDLGGCDSLQNDHLKGIGNSFLLKYLVLGGNCITGIPKEIVNLKLLQTLDLRASGLNELPESIFQAKRLERLCVNSHMKIPDGIGKMESLQELFDINISKPELLKEMGNITKLRVLKIAIWSWDGSLKSYDRPLLDYLRSLEQGKQQIHSLSILSPSSLDFMNDLGAKWEPQSLQKLEIKYGKFNTLPRWTESLDKLSSLSIEVYKLSQTIINVLGKLLTLKSLYLTSKHAPEGNFGIDTDGFKNLTSLHLRSNAMTEIFVENPEAMQMLKRVKLSFQAIQTGDVNQHFKFGLEHLCFLEHVSIEIICFNASRQVVQNAEDKIRRAISQGRSRHPNLEVRRIQEKDIVEDDIRSNTEQEQKEEPNKQLKQTDESPTEEVPTEGVPRKYKIVSLDLESQILTLQAI